MHRLEFTRVPNLSITADIDGNEVTRLHLETPTFALKTDRFDLFEMRGLLEHTRITEKYENLEQYAQECSFMAANFAIRCSNHPYGEIWEAVEEPLLQAERVAYADVVGATMEVLRQGGLAEAWIVPMHRGGLCHTALRDMATPLVLAKPPVESWRLLDQVADACLAFQSPRSTWCEHFQGVRVESDFERFEPAVLRDYFQTAKPEALEHACVQRVLAARTR